MEAFIFGPLCWQDTSTAVPHLLYAYCEVCSAYILGYAHFTTELKLGGPEQTRVGRVGDGRRESRLLTDGDETYWALAEGYLAPIGR